METNNRLLIVWISDAQEGYQKQTAFW